MNRPLPIPNVGPLVPYEPVRDGPWDRARAAHLLRRAGFGHRPGDLEKLLGVPYTLAMATVLQGRLPGREIPPPSWVDEEPLPPERARNLTREERRVRMQTARRRVTELQAWWLQRMIEGRDPLREKMVLFFHSHLFPTSAQKVKNPRLLYLQNELLRKHAFGSFGDLLRGIARDPAMLVYLDGRRNRKGKPNENFARELMELFTVGIGHYSENDVHEAARAFTGWTFRGDEFFIARRLHDDGKKEFLGRKGDFDGDDILEILLEQPATAERLAGKLVGFFVADDPDPALVRALAGRLRTSGYDLGDALGVLLRSRAFYAPESRHARVRGPVELVVGAVRALDAEVPPPVLVKATRSMGQSLFHAPSVKGWDGGLRWVDASALFARYNGLTLLVAGRRARGRDRRRLREGASVDPARLGLIGAAPDRAAARIGDLLFGEELPGGLREEVQEVLAAGAGESGVRAALALILASPAYQVC